jgi:glycerophosphoryl diester phosphodiesterase
MKPFLRGRCLVIGHRGCAHAPENTIAAFARAIELGAEMIEFDVREGLAVSHDPVPRGARPPSLDEALAYLAGQRVLVNVELKVPGLVRDAVRLLRRHRLVERTVVSSFIHPEVALAKRLEPRLAGGVLSRDALVDPARYVREIVGADVYSCGRDVFPGRLRGVPVHVYTVNEPAEMRRLVAAGAGGLFTDYPERLARLLAGTSPRAPARSRGRSRGSPRRS